MKIIGNIRRKDAETGFTMIEVIVASLVFAIAAAGIFATSAALNRPSEVSDEKLKAAFLGKQILESLRTAVNDDTWMDPSSDLALGSHPAANLIVIGGVSYNCSYFVMPDPSGSRGRRVDLNVTWL